MNEANYKDTQMTLTEAVLAPFFTVDFEHVLVCKDILRSNKLLELKNTKYVRIVLNHF